MKLGARAVSIACLASAMLCLGSLFYEAIHHVSPSYATGETDSESVESSPSSGPVGATIAVRGSGWPDADGEQVSFGFIVASSCSIVPNSQRGKLNGGSFSGWFRWPGGTQLDTYTVCAVFGSTTAIASTYTVLSESAPHVSISPIVLTAGKHATITGSNYFPAGITVQLFWKTVNGGVVFRINPVVSNSNGSISKTFTVPTTKLVSGSYMIIADFGKGQPPSLSSSVTFTYHAPSGTPPPTPGPRPDATPIQNSFSTVTATTGTTPTSASTTPAVSQKADEGQTPPTNTTGNPGGTKTTNQPSSIIPIVVAVGSLVLLLAIPGALLLVRRKIARSRRAGDIPPSAGLTKSSGLSWKNGQRSSSTPGNAMPTPMNSGLNTPGSAWSAAPAYSGSIIPVSMGHEVHPINGRSPTVTQSVQSSPNEMQFTPYTYLLQQSAGRSTGPVDNDSTRAPYDPTLEALKRQVQVGLFVAPRQRRNE